MSTCIYTHYHNENGREGNRGTSGANQQRTTQSQDRSTVGLSGDPLWESDLSNCQHCWLGSILAIESLLPPPTPTCGKAPNQSQAARCTLYKPKPQTRELNKERSHLHSVPRPRSPEHPTQRNPTKQNTFQASLFIYLNLPYPLPIPRRFPIANAPSASTQPNACVPSQTFIPSCACNNRCFPLPTSASTYTDQIVALGRQRKRNKNLQHLKQL